MGRITPWDPFMRPGAWNSPVSDWLAICCLTESGDEDLGGARLWNEKKFVVKKFVFFLAFGVCSTQSHTHCFSGCTTAIFLSFSTEKQRCLRVSSHHLKPEVPFFRPLGLCTRGFDGVDEWVPIGLTPADWEDVEGVHVNYQLWHWLFQTCQNTVCRTSMLHI